MNPLFDQAPLGHLTPGEISPERSVPRHIERPEYVGKAEPDSEPWPGGDVNDPATIALIRQACQVAAAALAEVGRAVKPGVTTDFLDQLGHDFLTSHGAYPSTLGYRGFPKSLCTSINEVICHGIPDSTVVQDGDIVNIDITAYLGGVHGDTNATFLAGEVDAESRLLVEHTREAMMRGIKAAKSGRAVNVIGRVIESYAKRFGYGVVRDYTGHGVGRAFHSGLIIPHYDAAPLYDEVIEPGMVFTIEPMLTLGTADWQVWRDGWTVVTADARRTAQFEHTILVTEQGPEILTQAGTA
jgi:methionyl aminopeptidase